MANSAQDPALKRILEHATRFHINLNGQVARDVPCARGELATIYRGTLRVCGIKVTLKVPSGCLSKDWVVEDVFHQLHIWSMLRHKNVLQLLGITTDFESTVSIVYRWIEKGNAHQYVQDKTVDPRPILQGIAQGLNYLHKCREGPIYHGNLKGFNVLISAEGVPLLTDIGFSYLVRSYFSIPVANGIRGTINWMAPEQFFASRPSAKGDVWAFGMTALELFTRKVPFHECISFSETIKRILYGSLPKQPDIRDTCSRMTKEWWDLCCQCWCRESWSRPTIATISRQMSMIISQQSQLSVVPDDHPDLSPTIDKLVSICPRSRILVIGKSGVGKSSLIKLAFGITDVEVSTTRPGTADIKREIFSQGNTRFVLHDSKGLGRQTYGAVTSFIQSRRHPDLDLKEQLHAVWICISIPLLCNGERLIDIEMREFLSKKREILGDVPIFFVFTKYDKIISYLEDKHHLEDRHYLEDKDKDIQELETEAEEYLEDKNIQELETVAEKYLQTHCVHPIKDITKEDIPYMAVSCRQGYRERVDKMVELTFSCVSKRFAQQLDGLSPVSVVTLMVQRVIPSLKVDGSITIENQGYRKALATTPDFSGHTIWDSLGAIHVDVVAVWNFCDPSQYLTSNEFRELMVNMVGDIKDDSNAIPPWPVVPVPSASHTLPHSGQSGQTAVAQVPIKMPLTAGLAFTRWVYNTYQPIAFVQRIFMAYIIDLTNVLKTLFCLVAKDRKLTRRPIKLAYNTYYQSPLRKNVHSMVNCFDPGAAADHDATLEKVESLVRVDEGLSFSEHSADDLEHDEEWHTIRDGK